MASSLPSTASRAPSRLRAHRAALCGAVLLSALAPAAFAQTKVVGYIPAYKGLLTTANRTDLTKLTHLNLAFLNPNSAGVVASGGQPVCMGSNAGGNVSPTELRNVVAKAHAANVKVLVSLAGGVIPACSGDWAQLLQPTLRQTVVNNLVQFVDDIGLDGIDVDIEGELLTRIDNAGHYTPFIQALDQAMNARGKLVTAATASYVGGMVPISSLPYFDFVTLMSYDGIYGNPGGEHSPYSQAVADINTWKGRGLPRSKLVLGVPFYGYGRGAYGNANGSYREYSFQEILNIGGSPNADLIGTACASCDYVTYNGLPTIRAKTRLGVSEGSGVMMWELSHDGSGGNSLLAAIDGVVQGGTNECRTWVFGTPYRAGDVVLYNGVRYIAEHDNPGYIPDVSTWYWEPTDAPCN